MEKTIVGGVFKQENEAVRAIESLQELGFTKDDISVFAKSDEEINDIQNETGLNVSNGENEESGRGKNAGKGLGIGAGTGGVLGGITGLIAEIGLLTIPGIGVLAAAGPIATTLSGAAIGATGGGLVGALVGAGIPKEQAEQYEEYLKNDHILVLVETEEERKQNVYGTFYENRTVNADMYDGYVVDDQRRY